jgi:hypothetical protein
MSVKWGSSDGAACQIWCERHAGGGTHVQVQCPLVGRPLPPQRECVAAVGLSLLVCHASNGAQVGQRHGGVTLDLGESEMCEGVELVAQGDQATSRLGPGRFVVGSPFVCFQSSLGGRSA